MDSIFPVLENSAASYREPPAGATAMAAARAPRQDLVGDETPGTWFPYLFIPNIPRHNIMLLVPVDR
jgi:hypothetical protein